MPWRIHKVKLGTRLIVGILAAVTISSTGVALFLITSGQRASRVEAFDLALGVDEAVSDSVTAFIGNIDSVLTSAALFPGFAELEPSTQRAILQNLLAEFTYFERLAVRNESGELLAIVRKGPEVWSPPPETVAAAFRTAIQGSIFISDLHYSSGRQPEVLVMVPISSAGRRPVGTIAGIVELGPLQSMVEDVHIGPESAVYIVDSHGRVIAHSELGRRVIGQSFLKYPVIKNAIAGKRDVAFTKDDVYIDPAGNRVVGVYRRLSRIGWSVVIQQPESIVFGPNYRMIGYALLWTLLFALVFGLIGLYLVRFVTAPISVLSHGAEILGAGNLSHRIGINTGDELEELANTVNQMAANLESSQKRLEEEHGIAVKSEREARILYNVSQSLVSTLDLEERLRAIGESLAQVCGTSRVAIWIIERNNMMPSVSLGLNPDEERVFRTAEVHLEDVSESARRTITGGTAIAVDDAQAAELPYREFAMSLNIRSVLALPITLKQEPIGFAITYDPGEVRDFTPDQIRLAQALASQTATAIENVRAYERERRIAETLQRALLPTVPPSIDDFEIADKYAPASAEAEIGGDFYDVFQLSPDKVGIVIADVSGKGLSAGVHTAMAKYMLRAYAVDNPDPVTLAAKLNNAVCKFAGREMFITLFYGVLDIRSKEMLYVNAGHELPLLYGEDSKICMRLITTGTAMGIVENYKYDMDRIDFLPGDVLLFYTDGATDARRNGEFLGIDGLETMFCSVASGDAHEIVDDIDKKVREYAGGFLRDDIALLVLKYRRAAEGRKPPGRKSKAETSSVKQS